MTATLAEPAELDQSARHRGGILANALPAPAGWQGGIQVPWYGCGEPVLRDKCIRADDVPHRTRVAEFGSFPIEQGATCSTLSRIDQEQHALDRLEATTEWAMGRQLATDQAGLGQPSFADGERIARFPVGTNLLNIPILVTAAIGCLEQAAADTGFGAPWVLHSSIRGMSYLANADLLTRGPGGTVLSPAGAPVIASTGYPGQAEGEADGWLRFWVTGRVWAAVDAPMSHDAVDRRLNDHTGWALRAGLVVFDPCLNMHADVQAAACAIA